MANYQVITPVQVGQTAITTAYTTLYTVPASTRTYLKQMDICNTTTGPITVSVSLVPSAGTAGASNALFFNASVPGGTTIQWAGTQVLDTSSTIQVKASATGLTVTTSGGEAV